MHRFQICVYYQFTFGRVSVLLLVCFLWMSAWVLWRLPTVKRFHPPIPKAARPNDSSSNITAFDMGISQEEWDRLQKVLDWSSPDHEITELGLSTSPVYTTFSIVRLNDTYKVGDKICVTITARDHNKNLKTYGGDFFQVKLFNIKLKASVYGEVIDHRNGTYTVDLLLPWEGQAQVSVRLMYSSEVVWILKKHWETSFPHSHYKGYFEGPGPNRVKIREEVECNIKWGSDGGWSKGNCCCTPEICRSGLKRMNLQTDPKTGPLIALELKNNIIIHWRPHGFPLRFRIMPAADLHYISNEIDEITGGHHTVVVFTTVAHMVFHPLTFFVHKMAQIRQAVVQLLMRAPETTVIIKSGNTGFTKDEYGIEWYRMQLNTVVREMFSDINGVVYFDVWQMTSCHYTHENIHPVPVIISNEIDMLLSFVCPS